MTRNELEAIIWRAWPTREASAYRSVDAILAAADEYALYPEPDVFAERRAVLAQAAGKKTP